VNVTMAHTDQLDRTPMSWEEYQSFEDVRAEYIDGTLVVSAAPTLPHQDAVLYLAQLLVEAAPDGIRAAFEWGWKPGADEFVPDVMVFDDTDETNRLTAVPHLAVEVLSTDRGADLIRKYRKYAETGLPRYWIVDLAETGPEIVTYELRDEVFVETGRHRGDTDVTLDVGPMAVSFAPNELLP